MKTQVRRSIPAQATLRRYVKHCLVAVLLASVLLPVLGLLLAPAFLCVADQPREADVVVLLGGEDGSRVERVTALFKAGWATHVIISGENEMYRRQLIQSGIPEDSIWVDTKADSTAENAIFSIQIMRAHGCKSALIVTSWYHTRRALNCFKQFGSDLAFFSQPTSQSAEVKKSWGSPTVFILKEYPKNLWYLFRYGVSPV